MLTGLAALYQANLTFEAVRLVGKPEQVVFNRIAQLLGINFIVLAIATFLFPFKKVYALVIYICCFLCVASYKFILSNELYFLHGWFTVVPLVALVWFIADIAYEKLNA